MADSALLLLAHGSRDPSWSGPIDTLAARLRTARPGLAVRVAFLEHAPPRADEVIGELASSGARRVVIAPLLLGAGTHARRDLAALSAQLRERHSGIRIDVLPILGEMDAVLEAMALALAAAVPDRSAE